MASRKMQNRPNAHRAAAIVAIALGIFSASAHAQTALQKLPADDLDQYAGKPHRITKAPENGPSPNRPARSSGQSARHASASAPPRLAADKLDSTAIARQAALDRAGFSPGLIDGVLGAKTTFALEAFQEAHGLPVTGRFDDPTLAALNLSSAAPLTTYTLAPNDLDEVGNLPTDWNEKAELVRLPYESIAALLAERGHCTQATLARLNPGVQFSALRAGSIVTLPNIAPAAGLASASEIEVDLECKTVCPVDRQRRPIAVFHCSVAKFVEKFPHGNARVIKVAFDPEYHFDPDMWPEVHTVKSKLIIPPGPRNPVGLAWIGLSLPGYGIHGTPAPELIGKTGSHGCIRLANWDAVRLAKIVRVGTPVRFLGS